MHIAIFIITIVAKVYTAYIAHSLISPNIADKRKINLSLSYSVTPWSLIDRGVGIVGGVGKYLKNQ